jgi:hypothetical protein
VVTTNPALRRPQGAKAAPRIHGEATTRRFRVSKVPDRGDSVQLVEALEAFARNHGPGRSDVDEHSLDPFPGSNHVARAWGHLIHRQDGRVEMEPHPWLSSQRSTSPT